MAVDLTKPVAVRGGLSRFGKTLDRGGEVRVAYFGGSITHGGGDIGWRGQTTAWLRQYDTHPAVIETQAAIGGTGSELGAFRLAADVLRARPDLLFIEYAVNDTNVPEPTVLAAMEGIVRHTQRVLPNCDICVIYTLAQAHLDLLAKGELPATVVMHEKVAAHYGLPSINLSFDVKHKLDSGAMRWADFSTDSCHPTEAGYAVYGQTMRDAMKQLLRQGPQSPTVKTLTPSPWERCDLRTITAADATDGWEYEPRENVGGWQNFDGVLKSDTSGAELRLKFTGTRLGLYYSLGPETGDLEYSIDGGAFQTKVVWDAHAASFWRPSSCMLANDLPPGEHEVTLRVAASKHADSKGRWTKLAHLLVGT
jgi:lysophospholipase L1-like esterase